MVVFLANILPATDGSAVANLALSNEPGASVGTLALTFRTSYAPTNPAGLGGASRLSPCDMTRSQAGGDAG